MRVCEYVGWHKSPAEDWVLDHGAKGKCLQSSVCESSLLCNELQKKVNIPGALISNSTQKLRRQSFFVAPPGREDELNNVKCAQGH
jgi:hypothetical protein